jgi:hypothetical protein
VLILGARSANRSVQCHCRRDAGVVRDLLVDEAKKTLTFNIEASTFPNAEGTVQTRTIDLLTADEFRNSNPGASRDGPVVAMNVYRLANSRQLSGATTRVFQATSVSVGIKRAWLPIPLWGLCHLM